MNRVLYLPDVAESAAISAADFARHGLACDVLPAGWFPRAIDANVPSARAVVGVGVGGNAAMRLALRFPERFPVVATLNAAFDVQAWHGAGTELDALYATREACRQDCAILYLDAARVPEQIFFACGDESEWFRGHERLREKLAAYGVPHTARDDANAEELLAFVAAALRSPVRRLL